MSAMEGMLAPPDAARARVLRFLGPFASPLLADREARVGVYGAFAITAAFALTCTAPRWVLTFGPLALGVPHLIADVRYLCDNPLAPRLLLAFAFTQSMHYAVWLRLIPEEDRARPGLRSFASSLHALEVDLGGPLVLLACIGGAVVLVWGLVDAGVARHAYLRVGGFHAYLELAVVTLLLLEGRIPLRRPC